MSMGGVWEIISLYVLDEVNTGRGPNSSFMWTCCLSKVADLQVRQSILQTKGGFSRHS
jgi:hypothetical protein